MHLLFSSCTFPRLLLTLWRQWPCRGQPAELSRASLGLQDFPALGSSPGNPEGQVIAIASSPSTVDLEGLPALWPSARPLQHYKCPRGLALAPGGQVTQDRPTFPAGTQPRWNPPFFPLAQLGRESGKFSSTISSLLLPSPQRHEQAEPHVEGVGGGGGASWSQCPTALLVRPSRSLPPSLRLQPSPGPRIRIKSLYLTPVWSLPHSQPSSDKRQSGA